MYQQPPIAPPGPPAPAGPPAVRGNWMAVTALVIGLVSLLLAFLPIINNFAFVLAIAGLGFGIAGWVAARGGRRRGKGMSIASVVLAVLAIAGVLVSQAIYANAMDELSKELSTKDYVPGADGSGSKAGGAGYDATKDVKITSCAADDLGLINANVKIVNHDDAPRSYMITAEAVRDGDRISELNTAVNDLRPGQTTTEKVSGTADGGGSGKFTCKIVSVDSFN